MTKFLTFICVLALVSFLSGSVTVFQKDVGYISLPNEEFKDPRIISIKGVNGEIVRNPLAGYDTSNAACADLNSRYNEAKFRFCSAQQKRDYAEAKTSHEYYLSHYNPQVYSFTPEVEANATAKLWAAQAWERRWINIYNNLLEGCNILELMV